MINVAPQPLLVAAVIAVGILHTLVPDHWAPIALLARQHGWERGRVARVALGAGLGHSLSTLAIGGAAWLGGIIFARRFGHAMNLASSAALIAFGAWVALGALRELRATRADEHLGHSHLHRHTGGIEHRHWHEHPTQDAREPDERVAVPLHEHEHKTSSRLALMLVLGSSPMLEGIPVFFAASRYGAALLAVMAIFFTLATVLTYVILCVASAEGAARFDFGPVERYGEALSGALIVLLGLLFLLL